MNRTKYLKGHCQSCGGHIEFPADAIGMSTECPHCGTTTDLLLAPAADNPMIPRRTIIWTAVTVLVLLLGLAATLLLLSRAEAKAGRKREAAATLSSKSSPEMRPSVEETAAVAPADFAVSEVKLQKTPGSSVIYAVGTVTNTTTRQRFGVKVFVDLLDASGQKLGEATDYQQVIEAGGQWNFKALVVESKAAGAKVAAVKEQP